MLIKIMTVLFIKDVIERFDEKASFTKEIAAQLNVTLKCISEQMVTKCNNKTIAIGGCDPSGRCNKKLLLESCKIYDVVIMPCIGGRKEYEAKLELVKLDCTVIDIEPPRIRHPKNDCGSVISSLFASAIVEYIKQL